MTQFPSPDAPSDQDVFDDVPLSDWAAAMIQIAAHYRLAC